MSKDKTILSNVVPLVFQWLPKEFGATVPNTEDYPYLQRLVDWAASEPQREIYLVVHGAGFRPEQMLSLKAQLNKVENIQIVDFNKIILDQDIIWPSSRDIKRLKENIIPPRDKEVISISRFGDTSSYIINDGKKLSELLSDIYVKNNSDNTELNYVKDVMPFGAKLDAMRLVMLQNIEKITHTKEAIYLDFDILPDEMGAQIGEVKILRDILMCGGKLNTRDLVGPLENSIIAIKEFSQPILEEMILNARKSMVSQLLANGNTSKLEELLREIVFGGMTTLIYEKLCNNLFRISHEEYFGHNGKIFKGEQDKLTEQLKLYKFQESGGKVKVTEDNSWKHNIDYTKTIPIDFKKLESNKEIKIITKQMENQIIHSNLPNTSQTIHSKIKRQNSRNSLSK